MVTLQQLLASRDERHAMQMQLIADHPHETLVCLTVVVPGSDKRNQQSLTVAHAAIEALQQEFQPLPGHLLQRDLPTGFEAYMLTSCNSTETKRRTCQIEDTHPLGRLFDIDVILPDGTPLSRQQVDALPRRCLLCDNEARFCMRNHTHTQQELWDKINQLINDYLAKK
ncbi:MAG: citrate lyase holo-[Bacteroidales bacterium]|nr:citrate lyase holo-[acyl-carrier protein] synthase [Bacteroidales bacterium]